MANDAPERDAWAEVNALFHDAIALAPAARAAFIDRAAGDERVKAEVRSLVAAHERSAGFLDRPAAAPRDTAIASGGTQTMNDEPERPVRVGAYEIRGVLGEGGMGVVYLAEDVRLGRPVALKAVAPRHAGDTTRMARLRREARAAAALHHPGIATVFALEEIGDRVYIAGEYVPGETLREELARGPLDPVRAIDTATAVARALVAAHDLGIVHRDLKPENLMRTPAGEIKILDFGLARLSDPSATDAALTGEGVAIGTPAYMSPEQIRGEAVDARSDLFSLGVVLYELVAGVRPFAASTPASTIAKILESDPEPLRPDPRGGSSSGSAARRHALAGLKPAAAAQLERAVMLCLRKRPGDRFPSARHLVAALEETRAAVVSGSHAGAVPPPTPAAGGTAPVSDARWWWRFHQIAAAVGYALLVIPLWRVRDLSAAGTPLFVAGLAGATAAGAVRLHLWFVSRLDPSSRSEHERRASSWRSAGDVLMTTVLAAEGIMAMVARENWGVLLIAAAVATLISFVLIEPATARAAFGEARPSDNHSRSDVHRP